jgi:hypothetical protein
MEETGDGDETIKFQSNQVSKVNASLYLGHYKGLRIVKPACVSLLGSTKAAAR